MIDSSFYHQNLKEPKWAFLMSQDVQSQKWTSYYKMDKLMAHTAYLVVNVSSISGCCKNIGNQSRHIYSPSLTALSAHLPCFFLLLAFTLSKWIICQLIITHTTYLVENVSSMSGCHKNIGNQSRHIYSPSLTALSAHLPCFWPLLAFPLSKRIICQLIMTHTTYLVVNVSSISGCRKNIGS
jgi:hypothetical protein